ncbi:NUDIX domain-containing protein [Streptomyces broussonetiae]|uniref:NUDIX domain-containing protein n=1 Tax=Streptomyces broussonetiae TaxID=2686304 RepID=A0ABV5EK99_9ACTN
MIQSPIGKLLLVQQPKWGKDIWTLPGGHLESGETLEQGACREGQEETGLDLRGLGLVCWGQIIDAHSLARPVHYLYFDYAFIADGAELSPERAEISDARWVSPDDALSYPLPRAYRRTIEEYLKPSAPDAAARGPLSFI